MKKERKISYFYFLTICHFFSLSLSIEAVPSIPYATNYYVHHKIKETAFLIHKEDKTTLIIQPVLQSDFATNLLFISASSVPIFYEQEHPVIFEVLQEISMPKFYDDFSSLLNFKHSSYPLEGSYPYFESAPYSFYVLFPFSGEELISWLLSSGFPLIAKDSINNLKKHFSSDEPIIAISFNKKIRHSSAITPLKLTFLEENAGYPLSLLFSHNLTKLDLFVVSENTAMIDGFSLKFCDKFYQERHQEELSQKDKSAFKGKCSNKIITQNEVTKYLWDGCVISYLSGEIPTLTDKLNRLTINFIVFKPVQQCFFSYEFAAALASGIFTILLVGGIILSLLPFNSTRRAKDFYVIYIAIAIVIFTLLAFGLYDTLPKHALFSGVIQQ